MCPYNFVNRDTNVVISPCCFHYQYLPKADLLSAIVSLIPSHPTLCVPALVCLCEWVLWPDPFWALVYRPLQCGKYPPSIPLKLSHSSPPPPSTPHWCQVPSLAVCLSLNLTLLCLLISALTEHQKHLCACVFKNVFSVTAVCTYVWLQILSGSPEHYGISFSRDSLIWSLIVQMIDLNSD